MTDVIPANLPDLVTASIKATDPDFDFLRAGEFIHHPRGMFYANGQSRAASAEMFGALLGLGFDVDSNDTVHHAGPDVVARRIVFRA